MALNTFKCNYLTPLHFKGLTRVAEIVTATHWDLQSCIHRSTNELQCWQVSASSVCNYAKIQNRSTPPL